MTTEPVTLRGAHGPPTRGGRSLLLFAALAFALSPVLLDLARHVALEPWALYGAVFPPLLVGAALREGASPPAPRLGWALVAGALVLEIATVGGGVVRFGRPAVPLAVVGLCRALGVASWRTALLAAWIVPIPYFVVGAGGIPLAETWAAISRAGLAAVGLDLALRPTADGLALVGAAGGALALRPEDGGLALAACLSGLGWRAGLREGAGWGSCALRASLYALVALPLQLLGVALAAAALAAGLEGLAAGLLPLAPWVAGAGFAAARLLRARAAAEAP